MTRRRLSSQRGMTLIEVTVTILVICTGTLATLGTYTHFAGATNTARERAVLISVAQREIEAIRPVSFSKLGLTGSPTALATTEAPLSGDAAFEPTVSGSDYVISPGGDDFTYRGARGRIYRYVTKRDVVCTNLTAKVHGQLETLFTQTAAAIAASIPNLCGTLSTTKRVTVIVVPVDDNGATSKGVRLTTFVQDPSTIIPVVGTTGGLAVQRAVAAVAPTTTPSAASSVTQTVNLTDTRCNATMRSTPSSHSTGDTAQTGYTCAASGPAPTLLTLGAIPGSSSDPVADFSTDVTRSATGGLSMLRDTTAGSCDAPSSNLVYSNAEAAVRRRSIHQWATKSPTMAMETPDSAGRASLSLWSSTADGQQAPGRLCVVLRREDTGFVLGSADFTLASWPSTPTELTTAFDLSHASIPAGTRLLLTLRVPSDSGSDIRVLYDHAKYASSLSFTMKSGKTLQ